MNYVCNSSERAQEAVLSIVVLQSSGTRGCGHPHMKLIIHQLRLYNSEHFPHHLAHTQVWVCTQKRLAEVQPLMEQRRHDFNREF